MTVWELFILLAHQPRTGGMGGFISVDLSCVGVFFDAFDVPHCDRRFMLEKLTILSDIASEFWNADKENESSRNKRPNK